MTNRMIDDWVIPPENDAEFVACMEEVLETYEKSYDPTHPLICMAEQPVQLLKETRVPIAATKDHPKRVDYEYERNGTASIFMFAEPLLGFGHATARSHRTKADWAKGVAALLDTRYADSEKVTIVLDNLNVHTKGAFHEAFEPDTARAYLKRINLDSSTSFFPIPRQKCGHCCRCSKPQHCRVGDLTSVFGNRSFAWRCYPQTAVGSEIGVSGVLPECLSCSIMKSVFDVFFVILFGSKFGKY